MRAEFIAAFGSLEGLGGALEQPVWKLCKVGMLNELPCHIWLGPAARGFDSSQAVTTFRSAQVSANAQLLWLNVLSGGHLG